MYADIILILLMLLIFLFLIIAKIRSMVSKKQLVVFDRYPFCSWFLLGLSVSLLAVLILVVVTWFFSILEAKSGDHGLGGIVGFILFPAVIIFSTITCLAGIICGLTAKLKSKNLSHKNQN